jgi:hypothetical protein
MEGNFGAHEVFQEKLALLRQSLDSLGRKGVDAGALRELSGYLDALQKCFTMAQDANQESKLFKGVIASLRKDNVQLKKAEKFVAQMEILQQQVVMSQQENKKLQEQLDNWQQETKRLAGVQAENKVLQEKLRVNDTQARLMTEAAPPNKSYMEPTPIQEVEVEQIDARDLEQVEHAVLLENDQDMPNRSFSDEPIERTTVLSLPVEKEPAHKLAMPMPPKSPLLSPSRQPMQSEPSAAANKPTVAGITIVQVASTAKAEATPIAAKRNLQTSILPIMDRSIQARESAVKKEPLPPLVPNNNEPLVTQTIALPREEEEILINEAEVLNILQIEMPRLEELIQQGKLTSVEAKDKSRKFKLKDVEKLRKQAMELDTVSLRLDAKKSKKSGRFKPFSQNDNKI